MALLGDSAHAMQPNLGQGGCMAIEDAFQLGVDMGEALDKVSGGAVCWQWGQQDMGVCGSGRVALVPAACTQCRVLGRYSLDGRRQPAVSVRVG